MASLLMNSNQDLTPSKLSMVYEFEDSIDKENLPQNYSKSKKPAMSSSPKRSLRSRDGESPTKKSKMSRDEKDFEEKNNSSDEENYVYEEGNSAIINVGDDDEEEKEDYEENYHYNDISYGDIYGNHSTYDQDDIVFSGSVMDQVASSKSKSTHLTLSTKVSSQYTITTNPNKKVTTKCLLRRCKGGMKGLIRHPTYELYDEAISTTTPVLLAKKSNSGYHIFDMTRGSAGNSSALSKKCGNYLGKVKVVGKNKSDFVLYNNKQTKEEIGCLSFEKISKSTELLKGALPRFMRLALPSVDDPTIPTKGYKSTKGGSMIDVLKVFQNENLSLKPQNISLLESKKPSLKDGRYYLNFSGRVKVGSMKNFQLVAPNTDEDDKKSKKNIICQFGKVSNNDFHLDFKNPLSPLQAFSIALCQFEFK